MATALSGVHEASEGENMNTIPIGCNPNIPAWTCETCSNFDGCKAWPKIKYLESVRVMDGLQKEHYREIYFLALQMSNVQLSDRFAFDKRLKDMIRSVMATIENKALEVRKGPTRDKTDGD